MTDLTTDDPQKARATRRKGLLRRFSRNSKGSIAIEFAALALPFSMLVFAILESCISFAAQQVLSNVTDDIAREMRTGQIRAATLDPEDLEERICNRLQIVVSTGCPGLEIDLKEYDSFEDAAKQRIEYTSTGDIDTSDFSIEIGLSGSKNQLRLFYRWPVITDFMRRSMANLPDGKTLHFASVTWQNEPFDD
ncbi:TadE/TadG family type IV pilus assembly protein [Mesorhizobium sp. CAU 1741]|uniref:TadE/TadG family type IV pilus assembly protein n=1 Tax=Mesorhizobium sp. CAU 1741 TaxID=3140366 RepID=UPI00325C1FF1